MLKFIYINKSLDYYIYSIGKTTKSSFKYNCLSYRQIIALRPLFLDLILSST